MSCITAYNLIITVFPDATLIRVETPDDSDRYGQEIEEFKKRGIHGQWRPKIRREK